MKSTKLLEKMNKALETYSKNDIEDFFVSLLSDCYGGEPKDSPIYKEIMHSSLDQSYWLTKYARTFYEHVVEEYLSHGYVVNFDECINFVNFYVLTEEILVG